VLSGSKRTRHSDMLVLPIETVISDLPSLLRLVTAVQFEALQNLLLPSWQSPEGNRLFIAGPKGVYAFACD